MHFPSLLLQLEANVLLEILLIEKAVTVVVIHQVVLCVFVSKSHPAYVRLVSFPSLRDPHDPTTRCKRPERVQCIFSVNPATSFGRTPWRALGPLLSFAPKNQYKAAALAVFATTIPDTSQVGSFW